MLCFTIINFLLDLYIYFCNNNMNNVKPIFIFNFPHIFISSDGLVGLLFLGSNLWREE